MRAAISMHDLCTQAIDTNYGVAPAEHLQWLQKESRAQQLTAKQGLIIGNSYFTQGIVGTHPAMFARSAVVILLNQIAEALPTHLSLIIYDTFRTIATQKAIFNDFYAHIQRLHPQWDAAHCQQETLRFASHPDHLGTNTVLAHNSGGAVDLAIADRASGTQLDFGTEFDEISDYSATDYFEGDYSEQCGMNHDRFLIVRKNRRMLFNLMKQAGFTNYIHEWWHFDLGTYHWAALRESSWQYPSMESEFENHVK
jgi:D-alanyl-D-alanine dipeptidase